MRRAAKDSQLYVDFLWKTKYKLPGVYKTIVLSHFSTYALVVTSQLWRSSLHPPSKHTDYSLFSDSCCYNYSPCAYIGPRDKDKVTGFARVPESSCLAHSEGFVTLALVLFAPTSSAHLKPVPNICYVMYWIFPKLKQTLYSGKTRCLWTIFRLLLIQHANRFHKIAVFNRRMKLDTRIWSGI